MVLRDGIFPANDLLKDGCCFDAHRLAQFCAHGVKQPHVVPTDNFGPIPAAAHGAQQHQARRGAIRVNGRAPLNAQDVTPGPLRSDKAEAVERYRDVRMPEAKCHHRNAVVGDGVDPLRQSRIQIGEDLCLLMSGTRQHHGIGWPAVLAFAENCPCGMLCIG